MTRDEFDNLPSNGAYACPDCGCNHTMPYPGCGCRAETYNSGGYHINKWHHTCNDPYLISRGHICKKKEDII